MTSHSPRPGAPHTPLVAGKRHRPRHRPQRRGGPAPSQGSKQHPRSPDRYLGRKRAPPSSPPPGVGTCFVFTVCPPPAPRLLAGPCAAEGSCGGGFPGLGARLPRLVPRRGGSGQSAHLGLPGSLEPLRQSQCPGANSLHFKAWCSSPRPPPAPPSPENFPPPTWGSCHPQGPG